MNSNRSPSLSELEARFIKIVEAENKDKPNPAYPDAKVWPRIIEVLTPQKCAFDNGFQD